MAFHQGIQGDSLIWHRRRGCLRRFLRTTCERRSRNEQRNDRSQQKNDTPWVHANLLNEILFGEANMGQSSLIVSSSVSDYYPAIPICQGFEISFSQMFMVVLGFAINY
jgi:hypothetical protein